MPLGVPRATLPLVRDTSHRENDRDEKGRRTADSKGENFARKTGARKRKRGTVGVGQSRGSSVLVKLNYAGFAARTKLLARI